MAQPHKRNLGEYPMTTRGREQGPAKRYRRLRFPTFTAAKWHDENPLLQRGELGMEIDTRKIKVGDGITYWNDLEYAKASGNWGDITGDITEQTDLVEFVNNAVAAEANIRAQADQQLQSNIDNVATNLTEHEQDTNNPHNVTKAQVGLSNVDNTSDADKPVSTAQATAINNAVSTHNASETAHSNQFSQYRTSANQDTIDNQIKSDVANLQSTKADKATTLAGYGITNAYTKTEVDAKVSSVYRFRGSVATYSDLPTTGQVIGDVWNVEDTGANYAWSGTEWDKLSETVDLTPYLTKAEASSTYATQSALAEVSTVAETAQSTADKADSAAEVAQQTANVAGTTAAQALQQIANIQQTLNGMDYPIYWDSADAADHSHAAPGVATPASGTWYRLYKSGWVEQGGVIANLTDAMARIVFPIIMADVNYTILAGQYVDNPNSHYWYVRQDIGVNGVSIKASAETVTAAYWQVVGYAGGGVSLFAYKATDGTVYYVGEIGMSDIDELILYMQGHEPGFLMQKNSSGGFDYVDYLPPIGITTSVLTIMLSTGGEIDCSRSPADDTLYYGK